MSYLITAEYIQEQMSTLGLKKDFAPSAYALDTLILEASDWVENYCDRKFGKQSVTETVYGSGYRRQILDNFPVVSVESVTWTDSLNQTGSLDVNDIRIMQGGILEFKTPWGAGLYAGQWFEDVYYTITYTTGFDVIPSNVKRATALKVVKLIQPQYQGPRDREIFMISDIDAMIVDLLEPYRRERLG